MTDNAMQSLVETKLTKSEAIDLLVQELRDDLADRIKANERAIEAARKSFTVSDITVDPNVFRLSERYGESKFTLSIDLTGDQFTVVGKAKLKGIAILEAEREELRKQEYALERNNGKAKNAILKTMLEGTEEGQRFLELLTGLKLKVSPKLLKSKES